MTVSRNSANQELKKKYRVAIEAGSASQIRALIEKGAKPSPLAFLIALSNKTTSLIPLLKEAGSNPDEPDAFGERALGRAVRRFTETEVKLLLDAGANPNLESAGLLPLVIATTSGKMETAKLLLECGAEVNKPQTNGLTALLHATGCGHGEMVKMFLDAGANAGIEGPDGRDSFDLAKKIGNSEIMELLRSRTKSFRHRRRPAVELLNTAIKGKDRENVNRYIRMLTDLSTQDRFGRSPLVEAVRTGDVWFVNRLLKAGAKTNCTDKGGHSPLTIAVRCDGKPEIVKALLMAGAVPRALSPKVGSPLSEACVQGRAGIARMLIDAGAKARVSNKFGVTLLMIAVSARSLPLVQLLVSKGLAVDSLDYQGRTALFYAALAQQMRTVQQRFGSGMTLTTVEPAKKTDGPKSGLILKFLLQHGADVNRRDKNGRTVLTYATSFNVARLLIKAGAKTDVKDEAGHNVAYWLKKNGIERLGI